MGSNWDNIAKTVACLLLPLLLLPLMYIPYSWVQRAFILKWLGCDCGKLDKFGNFVQPEFNANDFTALFWLFIALCTTLISVFLSKRIPKKVMWLRVLYIGAMFWVSMAIGYEFYLTMYAI